ncbi:MAG: IclR family transcriptional regulator [Lachnospiraceae bacterium]|nr:IclR family transcriptional regulator [Lachnospiraceae bacterium]
MIQSILKANSVLNYIARHQNRAKLANISKELGINRSTLHGILQSLVYCNLLIQDPDTSYYSLGPKIYELGKIYEKDFSLVKVAKPFMKHLNEAFQESVHLAIESNQKVLYIECIQSTHSVRTNSSIGGTDPLYATSAGKIILSYADGNYVDDYLRHCSFKPLTPNTITQIDDLTRQFDIIRTQGYAVDNEEVEIGLRCISVPILGADESLYGVISVSGPTNRMDQKLNEVIHETVTTCHALSCSLGC